MNICLECKRTFVPREKSNKNRFCSRKCYWDHPRARQPLKERFLAFVEIGDGCWIWKGTKKNPLGYGGFTIGVKQSYAHRVSWEILTSDICSRNFSRKPRRCPTQRKKARRNNGQTKLKESDVLEIRKLKDSGTRMSDLARTFGCAYQTIVDVVNRRNWSHL